MFATKKRKLTGSQGSQAIESDQEVTARTCKMTNWQ